MNEWTKSQGRLKSFVSIYNGVDYDDRGVLLERINSAKGLNKPRLNKLEVKKVSRPKRRSE